MSGSVCVLVREKERGLEMERKRKRVQENMGAKEKQRVGYKEN